ncbi:hypothetical protein PENTCL1PPCAC_10111, partial [Pristionchus entomophagus]
FIVFNLDSLRGRSKRGGHRDTVVRYGRSRGYGCRGLRGRSRVGLRLLGRGGGARVIGPAKPLAEHLDVVAVHVVDGARVVLHEPAVRARVLAGLAAQAVLVVELAAARVHRRLHEPAAAGCKVRVVLGHVAVGAHEHVGLVRRFAEGNLGDVDATARAVHVLRVPQAAQREVRVTLERVRRGHALLAAHAAQSPAHSLLVRVFGVGIHCRASRV